ncbi:MAG: tetratricopeptide repeat protein [Verrucomicrobiales bacterium]
MKSRHAMMALAAAAASAAGAVAEKPKDSTPPFAVVDPSAQNPIPPALTAPTAAPSNECATSDSELSALREKAAQPQAGSSLLVKLGDTLMQESRGFADGRFVDEAERAYQRALTLDRKNAEAMVGLAWVCHSRHEFEEGNIWAGNALVLNPHLSRAHALLGDAAVEVGVYDKAFEHYQEALDLLPDLSSYSRASQLMWLTGDVTKACWLMEKAISAGGPHPENTAWCQTQLAKMLFETGQLQRADQQVLAALQRAPTNPQALLMAGRIKVANNDYDAATELFGRVLDVAPNHEALVALGDLHALTGRPAESEALYRRVVDLHRNGATHGHGGDTREHTHRTGNTQLARFLADHDRHLEEALMEAVTAYERYPNVFVADTLAWCHYKLGQYSEAHTAIQAAMRWNTPDAAMVFHAGMIAAKRGDPAAAASFLERALKLNPHFHPLKAVIALDELKRLAVSTPDNGIRSLGQAKMVEE